MVQKIVTVFKILSAQDSTFRNNVVDKDAIVC